MHKTLYRAYRPQVFEDVIGQEIISSTLKNAIKENKVAHSYLFSGRSGTGKTTLAKIFAKAVNCVAENKPCNNCETCNLINKEQTVDFIEIDAASNNGVEQIRNLIESIQYPPIVCKYKVYIIDEVHMLSNAAFNALLKTLEEPPTNSIFILATTEEHKIPETILTRCQRFNLQKISNSQIANLVADVLEKENKKFEINATQLIADMSSGGARKALSITEQCMHLEEIVTVDVINKAYGLLTTKELINLVTSIYESERLNVAQILNYVNEKGTNYQRLLEEVLIFFKEILIKDISLNNFKFINETNKNNFNFSDEFIFKAIDIIQNSLTNIKFSSNPKLSFEITIYQLTKINSKMDTIQSTVILEEKTKIKVEKETQTPFEKPKPNPTKENSVEKIPLQEDSTVTEPTQEKVAEKVVLEKEPKEEIKKPIDKETKEAILEELKIEEETLVEEITFSNEEETENFNEILNVLLASTKIQREFLSKKLEELKTISRNPQNSKWISILSNSKIVAASNEAGIIMFDYEPSANILNNKNTNQDFLAFIKNFFGREYLFLGTWKDSWEKEKENYKNLRANNSLPEFREIVVPKVEIKTIKDNTEVQEAIDLFGDLLEIEGVNNE